jgi:hypothetical protein
MRAFSSELSELAYPRLRAFVCEGIEWLAWPSVVVRDEICETDGREQIITGPPRLFFRSRSGEFYSVVYPGASWDVVASLSESELQSQLQSVRS